MKSSHKFWLVLFLVPLGIITLTVGGGCLLGREKHPQPLDLSKRGEMEKMLNEEAERIELPPGTEVLDRSSYDKGFSIYVFREYRNALNGKDFRKRIIGRMTENGWIDMGETSERTANFADMFCKKGYNAIWIQENRGIWQDEFYYYKLNIVDRDDKAVYIFETPLPEECKNSR
jgi:hypothetical protein